MKVVKGTMLRTLFFELIRVALGTRDALTTVPSADEWKEIYELARKQTLIGVCFSGVERLPKEQRPPKELILHWWAITRQIEGAKSRDGRTDQRDNKVLPQSWIQNDNLKRSRYRSALSKTRKAAVRRCGHLAGAEG